MYYSLFTETSKKVIFSLLFLFPSSPPHPNKPYKVVMMMVAVVIIELVIVAAGW